MPIIQVVLSIPTLLMPSRHCRCVSDSVATLINNPNLVDAQLIRRCHRRQAVDGNARGRVDVDDL